MMEENPNTCKGLIAATNLPSNSPFSYFISVPMRPQSKLSIKIPNFMVKTMQRRKFQFYGLNKHHNAHDGDKRRPRPNRGNQFPMKAGSLFSSNRSLGRCLFKWKKYEAHGDSESLLQNSGSEDGKEASSRNLGNNVVYEDHPAVAPLSQLLKLEIEETREPDDAEEGKHVRKKKHPLFPLSRFSDKKKGWNFIKTNFSSDMQGYNSEVAEDTSNVVTSSRLLRIKVRSCRLVKVVSRILTITRSLKKEVTKQFEQDLEQEGDRNNDEDEEGQLCKKRILMGSRCKALHSSGTLQYDSDGLLIPDVVT